MNIIRHSGAKLVKVVLTSDEDEIRLTVTDNGCGLEGAKPKALARRARLLGAEFRLGSPASGPGTMITLIL